MAYYNTCRICGANLDPGEPCDCEKEKVREQNFFNRHLKIESETGQVKFVFGSGEKKYEKMCS